MARGPLGHRPPASLARALRQAEKPTAPPMPTTSRHPPTEHRPHVHPPPPRAHLYPLHLPLDEAKKLFPSSFPYSPSSASLCAREAVTTLCYVCRVASGTRCHRRRATTPRLKSRWSSWPCTTEPPPRAVPKFNQAPSSSTSKAASPVPAATGHGIASAPHRRASPDHWTPH
jgi:hypothetical protein